MEKSSIVKLRFAAFVEECGLNLGGLRFPDERYEAALGKVVTYFKSDADVFALVLTGSLARGKAVEGSCVDVFVLLSKKRLACLASSVESRVRAYGRMGGRVVYYDGKVEGGVEFDGVRVDLGFTDGVFGCGHLNSFDVVQDELETSVGNLFVYSVPLCLKGGRFELLKRNYLPYYDDALRRVRLDATAEEFGYKVRKAEWLAGRGEFVAGFYALLEAERIFLQHVFIKERKYPIDYVKWLKDQCEEVLEMPELYGELVRVVEGVRLNQRGISEKCVLLKSLFERYGDKPSSTD